MAERLYYIQNKGYVGNCLIWWKQGRCGYTCDLSEALKVNAAEAAGICRSRPNEDIPWDAFLIDEIAHRHVDCESLKAAQDEGVITKGIRP